MKIGLQTFGSDGDVRPLMALAQGLGEAGHRVTLVVTHVEREARKFTLAEATLVGLYQR